MLGAKSLSCHVCNEKHMKVNFYLKDIFAAKSFQYNF